MSKAVLISIQPKWCELIAKGKKTLEVRKTKPKLETPFKCYIYCTLQGSNDFFKHTLNGSVSEWNKGNWGLKKGNVIGEFVCDAIFYDETYGHNKTFYDMACMSAIDVAWYALQSPMYGWHITNFKIYDKPKELAEFGKTRPPQSWCYVEERDEMAEGNENGQKGE